MGYMTNHNGAPDNGLDFDPNADYLKEVQGEGEGAAVQEQVSAESALDAQVVMNQVAETVGTGEPSPQDSEAIAEITSRLKIENSPISKSREKPTSYEEHSRELEQEHRIVSELCSNDKQYQDTRASIDKWRDGYKTLGGKLVAGAKGLEIVGVGGGVAAASLGAFAALTEGGALLTNPVTFGAVMVGASSLVIGEAIKLYQRYKERNYRQQNADKEEQYSEEAIRRIQQQSS